MAKAKSNFSVNDIKRNLFWVFVPLAILMVWGVFFVAHSKATADYRSRMQELDTLKKATSELRGKREHPNQGTIDAGKLLEQELRGIVYKSWEEMYRAQKLNCTWSNKLDPRFIARVENLKWMDSIPGVEVREWYNTFIAEQIPEFLEMANRRTVEVKVPDPFLPGQWKKVDGEDLFIPLDPYVAKPDEMIRQNATLISAGTGMGGSMMGGSGGSMTGGPGPSGGMMSGSGGGMGGGGFSSFSTTAGSSMGGSGSGMGGGMSGLGSDMAGLGNRASDIGTSLDNIYDPDSQRVYGIVDWPTPEIFTIVTWSGPSPYSGQIWYAQEEVWVYESLINVVRKINERVEATGPQNAAIKRIEAMLIGKNAASIVGSPGILEPLGSLGGGGGMMGMDSMMGSSMMGGSPMGGSSMGGSSMGGSSMGGSTMGSMSGGMGGMSDMMGGGMSSGPMSEDDTNSHLKRFRYVGEDLKPLSDSDSPPFTEFNMMPVCLELIVDQRRIPEILVECANSTMPIDIKLVRYNPANAVTGLLGGSAGGMGGMGSMMGGSGGMTGGPGPSGGMMSGSSGGMGAGMGGSSGRSGTMAGGGPGGMGSAATDALSGFEVGGKIGVYGSDAVMVQIVGVIYIYNEPDPKLLAAGTSAQESGLESGVDQDVLDQLGGAADTAGTGLTSLPVSATIPDNEPEPDDDVTYDPTDEIPWDDSDDDPTDEDEYDEAG